MSTTAGVIATPLHPVHLMLTRRLFVNRNMVKITPLITLKKEIPKKTLKNVFNFFVNFNLERPTFIKSSWISHPYSSPAPRPKTKEETSPGATFSSEQRFTTPQTAVEHAQTPRISTMAKRFLYLFSQFSSC